MLPPVRDVDFRRVIMPPLILPEAVESSLLLAISQIVG
jgi:hypothetical protein